MTDKVWDYDLLKAIDDLTVQAINEKSHYYTANVLRMAKEEILRLRYQNHRLAEKLTETISKKYDGRVL
jgi:16S rRNA U1498 N3-methylase RsmE